MRIFLGSLLLILTFIGGRYVIEELKRPPQAANGPMELIYRPLVLDSSEPERTQLGDLHFLGAWELAGPDRGFGGLSSLYIAPDGRIRALNDTAIMFTLPKPGEGTTAQVKRMPFMGLRKARWKPGSTDSESMVYDPASDRIWAGFELTQMICRYTPDLTRAEACRTWPEMKDWVGTSSIESMARMPDGRFIVIAEGAYGVGEGRDTLLFAGDPASPKAQAPLLMRYMPPVGYDPTDAVALDNHRLLVLNRRATFYDGFTAILTLIDIRDAKAGKILPGRVIARFAPPVLADNFEGLTLERDANGQRILWVLSDDNHLFFQRTLLLKFLLPASL